MNILFIHNNFPAQYRHIAARLAADPGNVVAAIGSPTAQDMPHVVLRRYGFASQDLAHTHTFARRFDLECRRAEQVLYAAIELEASGFQPQVVMAHSGWGESLPLRALFPRARIVIYSEFFYRANGQDVDFDPEFPDLTLDGRTALHLKNATQLLSLIEADYGLSPTQWQRSTYPRELQDKIRVIHEGIDTRRVAPKTDAVLTLPSGRRFEAGDEVVTFVSRDLEPLRGYHVFMRALPKILRERPCAEAVVIGGERVSYGMGAPEGTTWKQVFLDEVGDALDRDRVHFLGNVSYETFLSTLQVSAAHIYLTYPFVLSWSFIEAMSAGGLVITGDVGPTREVLDESCGFLLPFHDSDAIAECAVRALADPTGVQELRRSARERAIERFDLSSRTLPAMLDFLEELIRD